MLFSCLGKKTSRVSADIGFAHVLIQVCFAIWRTPAWAILARKGLTVTQTPWAARPSAPAPWATSGCPAIRTLMSVRWVKNPFLLYLFHKAFECGNLDWDYDPWFNLVGWKCLFALQVPTLVSMEGSVWTPRARFSANAKQAMWVPAVSSTSTSACPTLARMMPRAWTKLEASNASACQVRAPPSH